MKLRKYLVLSKSNLGSLFSICTIWKVIYLVFNCSCTCTSESNPSLLLSFKYCFQCLSFATILWFSALARVNQPNHSPWIRHYWAMTTQETAGILSLLFSALLSKAVLIGSTNLSTSEQKDLSRRIIIWLSSDLWQTSYFISNSDLKLCFYTTTCCVNPTVVTLPLFLSLRLGIKHF